MEWRARARCHPSFSYYVMLSVLLKMRDHSPSPRFYCYKTPPDACSFERQRMERELRLPRANQPTASQPARPARFDASPEN